MNIRNHPKWQSLYCLDNPWYKNYKNCRLIFDYWKGMIMHELREVMGKRIAFTV